MFVNQLGIVIVIVSSSCLFVTENWLNSQCFVFHAMGVSPTLLLIGAGST
jgi:hypothetical protein